MCVCVCVFVCMHIHNRTKINERIVISIYRSRSLKIVSK